MKQSDSKPTIAAVRDCLSRRLIKRVVYDLGLAETFRQSQSLEGYERACDAWHNAYWAWVDLEAPAHDQKRLGRLACDWSKIRLDNVISRIKADGPSGPKLPPDEAGRRCWVEELFRQEFLQDIAVFQLAMRGSEAAEPDTYDLFAPDILPASNLGIQTYKNALARQKQRKPTKDRGDRRLKPELLVYWIPASLWALTTEGIAQFLNAVHPRSFGRPYDNKTISDVCRDLKLYRLPRPLWHGLTGNPVRFEPL